MSTPKPLSSLLPGGLPPVDDDALAGGDASSAEAPMRRVSPEQEAERRVAAYRRHLHAAGIHERFAPVRLAGLAADGDAAYAKVAASVGRWAAASGRMEDRAGRLRTGILLTGDFGVGKTTIATAAFKELLWRTGRPGLWRKTYAALRYVQAGYASGEGDTRLRELQTTHSLLLDDVGDVEQPGETDDRARLLYEILDTRSDRLLPTILTSNLGTEGLAALLGTRTTERIREMCATAAFPELQYPL